jgi:hypothetical protein
VKIARTVKNGEGVRCRETGEGLVMRPGNRGVKQPPRFLSHTAGQMVLPPTEMVDTEDQGRCREAKGLDSEVPPDALGQRPRNEYPERNELEAPIWEAEK